uniref:Uncharacterized protein n=1 Tax=Rhizophora mucronata TaxID=61149 RepID=A0A2P2P830_RHIMU
MITRETAVQITEKKGNTITTQNTAMSRKLWLNL